MPDNRRDLLIIGPGYLDNIVFMLLIPACVQTTRLFHSTRRHGFVYGVGLALIHGLPDRVHAHRNLSAVDPCVWYLFCIVEPNDEGKKIMIADNLI